MIKWIAPDSAWYKCNTYGACKGNSGPSTYGFCIRSNYRDLIYVEAGTLGESNSLIAETITIWKALEVCKEQTFHNIILETDSLSLHKIVRKG